MLKIIPNKPGTCFALKVSGSNGTGGTLFTQGHRCYSLCRNYYVTCCSTPLALSGDIYNHQASQNAAFDQGLHCLLIRSSMQNTINMKTSTINPPNKKWTHPNDEDGHVRWSKIRVRPVPFEKEDTFFTARFISPDRISVDLKYCQIHLTRFTTGYLTLLHSEWPKLSP